MDWQIAAMKKKKKQVFRFLYIRKFSKIHIECDNSFEVLRCETTKKQNKLTRVYYEKIAKICSYKK